MVATRQLHAVGLDDRAIARRVAAGRLHRLHRGVYAVGHEALGQEGVWLAAVLAAGPGAALRGFSAGLHLGILEGRPGPPEVLAPRSRRSVPGVRLTRGRRIADVADHRGVPTTTVARTLLDLAGMLPVARLERAVSRAQYLGVYDLGAVADVLGRARGRRGAGALAALTGEPVARLDSDLEADFLTLCRRAALPEPERQVPVVLPSGRRVRLDFAWSSHGLVVEVDGRAGHLTPAAFEADRARDAELIALGHRVVRFSHAQVREGRRVVAILRRLLDHG